MRVLCSTTAGAGHFGPMVPVAHACIEAGHEVVVAAPESFALNVQGAGLTHVPFPDVPGEQLGAIFGRLPTVSREEANRIVIGEVFGRLDAQAALPAVVDLIADWAPDIVVREPAEFSSLIGAARVGVPHVEVACGFGSLVDRAGDVLDEPLRELEALAGIEASQGDRRLATIPTLTPVPAVLDDAARGPDDRVARRVWRYRATTSTDGPAVPVEWGDPAAPLLYVTFGSVAASLSDFADLYPGIVDALADLSVRVLLTTGRDFDLARLGPLPDNTWATQWWPQDAAMRDAALVIGHGGFGTTMSAVAAGVPQIVLPLFAGDQFLNAECIHATGAGAQLVGGSAVLADVAPLVHEVLDDQRYRDAALGIANDIAALPSVTSMVEVLEQLAG